MKKKFLRATFVAAIAMVCGINVFNAQKSEPLSDVVMANVEALANDENQNPGFVITCDYYPGICWAKWGNMCFVGEYMDFECVRTGDPLTKCSTLC